LDPVGQRRDIGPEPKEPGGIDEGAVLDQATSTRLGEPAA